MHGVNRVTMWWLWTLVMLGTAAAQLFELNIIHYNDFHARFEETSLSSGVCNPEAGDCIGGLARLVTAINEIREVEPDSLLFNAGDTFQGSLWYNFLRWNVTQLFMNMLPHDAHVLGNHEFDHDIEGLVPYLEHLEQPMLAANVDATLEPVMQGLFENHIIVERGGRRIGVIGVLLTTFSAPTGQIVMTNELEAVRRESAILTEQGVDIIIVLSHCGFELDKRIAADAGPEIDIIVGGHSHTLLYTGDAPNNDFAADDYPTIVTQANGHEVLIVQASAYTRYLGNIKLYFNEEGIVQDWEGQPIFLGTSIVPDAHMVALLEPFKLEMDAIGKEVLGTTKVTLNRSWCYSGECNIGNFVCDGLLESVIDRATGTNWHYAHVSLVNAGGLRVQINPGEITTEALLLAVPFENYVLAYDLLGRYLLEALEFSVGVSLTPGSFYSTRMLQVGGMRVVYNESQPVGSRVASARIRCIECDVPTYEPLDVDKTYKVVTQDYIGDGGGGYSMLLENRQNVESLGVDYVVLQEHLRRQDVILQDLDGRITIVQ